MNVKKTPFELCLPWISYLALEYIEMYIEKFPTKSLKAFEYGSGGSTLYFLNRVGSLTSIEHDQSWFKKMKEKTINFSNSDVKLVLPEKITEQHFKSHENPRDYYTGFEAYKDSHFHKYATAIDVFNDFFFDLVLIDGRSRVSCIYHSINKIKSGGILILDNAERERYFIYNLIKEDEFELIIDHYGALISGTGFVKTNIYRKI